jgi:hypothetical protein
VLVKKAAVAVVELVAVQFVFYTRAHIQTLAQ